MFSHGLYLAAVAVFEPVPINQGSNSPVDSLVSDVFSLQCNATELEVGLLEE